MVVWARYVSPHDEKGIEVWGYRRNYEKLKKRMKQVMLVELPLSESLVQVVHNQDGMVGKAPGIFQLVIPQN